MFVDPRATPQVKNGSHLCFGVVPSRVDLPGHVEGVLHREHCCPGHRGARFNMIKHVLDSHGNSDLAQKRTTKSGNTVPLHVADDGGVVGLDLVGVHVDLENRGRVVTGGVNLNLFLSFLLPAA